ncbi:MAG: polyphosphate kinase 1 [Planctomycetales bacterium]|nr:polyphosphate kinase 1 [Planctomycetales bacterium]
MQPLAIAPEHFLNRELSWLEFNARVLEEAQDVDNPLLERVKFLSIVSSNLDEFFMVRVAGLREQAFSTGTAQDANPDELKPLDQLRRVCSRTQQLVAAQYACWHNDVQPNLEREGIRILSREQGRNEPLLDKVFRDTVFPVLTPMAIDPSHPRPRYHNRALYLAAMLARRSGLGPKSLFAVVHLPLVLPRLVPVPGAEAPTFIFLEDLIAARLPELFGGFDVRTTACFRVTRDSDIDVISQESDDMLRMIEERLLARRRADAVRLEISTDSDEELVNMLAGQEQLKSAAGDEYTEVYRISGPLDLTGLTSLLKDVDRDDLRDRPFTPQLPRGLRRSGEDIFRAIANRDILLHHPYDSFEPVVDFIERAAEDPKVLAIKQTLYRTSGDSPIVRALIGAAEEGKHVTALVELKARFDEEANVGWARQMERAGVHVVYGFLDLKTHCKVALVVRQEEAGLKRYLHLGTGNYNPTTARLYTDVGLFTCDEATADDVSALFNLLTGYSQGHKWAKLIVAPEDLHRRTIQLIEEQTRLAEQGAPARIFAKLNALVDRRTIEALYRASQAGVPIDLVIRGICGLRPQIPGLSENIRVISIVDRFLEHSRVYVFGADDNAQIFLASADWMPRNFYRRVEVMFPVESPPLKSRILQEIIPAYLKDNVKARVLGPDGTYERVRAEAGDPPYRSQEELLKLHLALTSDKPSASSSNGSESPDAALRPQLRVTS